MSKQGIKNKSKQESQNPEIIIDVGSKSLGTKNQNNTDFQRTLAKNTSKPNLQINSINSKYDPVDKSIVKDAFTNLKITINRKSLFHLNLKILLKIFKGLIAKQILKNYFQQQTIKKPYHKANQNCDSQFKLTFDLLIVEDKKNVLLDLEKQSPKQQVFIIRKTKWNYIKQEYKKTCGKMPDYLFFIQIFKNKLVDDLYNTLESRNLKENLSVLEKWVLNYSGNYSAKILGWINGINVEKLNDSSRIQPQGITLQKPAFWCYVGDPLLKPINDFSLSF